MVMVCGHHGIGPTGYSCTDKHTYRLVVFDVSECLLRIEPHNQGEKTEMAGACTTHGR